jgi:cyclic beta-1,2-glucan synthetase
VWALMAHAKFAREQGGSVEAIDRVYRDFTYLSPAHRAAQPESGAQYGIEPYVMAGDVYSQTPYVGRGGWSWYTGAAAWMHRAAIESIFGLHLDAQTLSFTPCLPSHWPKAELTLRRDGRSMRFILIRASEADALTATKACNATLLQQAELLHWPQLDPESCFVIALPTS